MTAKAARENRLHTVYTLRDSKGAYLYIGVTCYQVEKRLAAHRSKPWWPEVAMVDEEHVFGRGLASLRELELIHLHEPRYNDQGTEKSRERTREQWRRWREARDADA